MKKLAVLSCALLGGCGAMPPTPQQAAMIEQTRPICHGQRDCELQWSAARQWVLRNAGLKFQVMTDDYMETYNPPQHSTALAAMVQKLPLQSGSYKIEARVWCANLFGCDSDPERAVLDFNRSVSAAAEKPPR